MKRIILASILVASSAFAHMRDVSCEIPEIDLSAYRGFKKTEDVAQYKFGDWSRVVGIVRGATLNDAFTIANGNPEITFFFYTKGWQMVLETPEGDYRVFRHGDVVFFSGEPHWGEANGLADGYQKS